MYGSCSESPVKIQINCEQFKFYPEVYLTLSWQRFVSYRNQFIDFQSKSMDWFLYDTVFRHQNVKTLSSICGEMFGKVF